MKTPSQDDKTIRIRRFLPYAGNEIFAAFADPSRLAKWWGPNGFTNTFETFEFRAGGNWKFTMHGPDGTDYLNENVFVSLEPGKKVVIKHLPHPHFTLSVSLVPSKTGTQIEWDAEFEDPKVLEAFRHIAEPGGEQNLDRLHKHLRGELA